MPRRMIERRGQSAPATHPQQHLFGCWGLLVLDVTGSGLVFEACERCGRVIKKWAVVAEPQRQYADESDDDPGDCDDIQPWQG